MDIKLVLLLLLFLQCHSNKEDASFDFDSYSEIRNLDYKIHVDKINQFSMGRSSQPVIIKADSMHVKGWIYNTKSMQSLDNVYCKIDENFYPMHATIREDVVKAYKNPNLRESGIETKTIDITHLMPGDHSVEIVRINKKNSIVELIDANNSKVNFVIR